MKKKILLVDDSETVLMLERIMLLDLGAEFVSARDGVEALEKIQAEKPDIILLDINMPRLDGINVCRQIKSDPETSHIPVVIITTKGQDEMVALAMEAGCDAFITKPVDQMELIRKIRRFLWTPFISEL